jgi:DnaJ-domain-containing protein 1
MACGALLFLMSSTDVNAFQQTPIRLLNSRAIGELPMQSSARAMREEEATKENRLMDEFRIFDGELINPYKVLGVSRECSSQDIRTAYRSLSRRYHPDVVMHKTILPGSW